MSCPECPIESAFPTLRPRCASLGYAVAKCLTTETVRHTTHTRMHSNIRVHSAPHTRARWQSASSATTSTDSFSHCNKCDRKIHQLPSVSFPCASSTRTSVCRQHRKYDRPDFSSHFRRYARTACDVSNCRSFGCRSGTPSNSVCRATVNSLSQMVHFTRVRLTTLGGGLVLFATCFDCMCRFSPCSLKYFRRQMWHSYDRPLGPKLCDDFAILLLEACLSSEWCWLM